MTRIVRPGKPRCHQRPIEGLLPKRSAATAKCFPLSPADRSPGFLGSRLKNAWKLALPRSSRDCSPCLARSKLGQRFPD